MAPRRRARAGQSSSNAARSTFFGDLPDDLLVRCLGLLDLKQRQRAALVSRRLFAAACSPELLREVDVSEVKRPAALESLAAWLARHGQHVRQLELLARDSERPCFHVDPAVRAAMEAALTSCLEAASLAGQLVQLTAGSSVTATGWLAGLPSLQRLELRGSVLSAPLHLSPAISSLTALASLRLHGSVIIEAALQFPTSITQLRLSGRRSQDYVPKQVTQLPQLARLKLSGYSSAAGSMDQLSCLVSSLTRLDLKRCLLPATLRQLTRLQHLNLEDAWAGWNVDIDAAISKALVHLTQITTLLLLSDLLVLPPAVASLPRLQRCYLCIDSTPLPLPAGPWLASLRWLGGRLITLASSTAVLSAASSLEFVELIGDATMEWDSPEAAVLLDWLAAHPPLRTVVSDEWCRGCSPEAEAFDDYFARLRSRRPALTLHHLEPLVPFNHGESFISRSERQ